MRGLRLQNESANGLTRQLEQGMGLLRDHLEPLHWALGTDFRSVAFDGTPFREWEESFDELIVAEWPGARLARPGFFPAYAKFVLPDWTDLVGFTASPKAPPLEEGHDVDLQAMAHGGVFYASCTDAAHWEMYSPIDEWLLQLHAAFPTAQEVLLENKRV